MKYNVSFLMKPRTIFYRIERLNTALNDHCVEKLNIKHQIGAYWCIKMTEHAIQSRAT